MAALVASSDSCGAVESELVPSQQLSFTTVDMDSQFSTSCSSCLACY